MIHVRFIRRADAADMTLNAPLFEGAVDANALVEGTWGADPVPGLEARPGDLIVRKNRMSAWEGTALETILKAQPRHDHRNRRLDEHEHRTHCPHRADKGYIMVIPEDGCSTMNADWHRASIDYAMQNVALVTTTDRVIAALG